MTDQDHHIRLIPAGIDTYSNSVVYMHADCHVCRSEGFRALTRVRIESGTNWIIATLNVVTDATWLPLDSAALSNAAWEAMGVQEGARGVFSHANPPAAASAIRSKVYGDRLSEEEFHTIMQDALARRLSDLELAAFITASAGDGLDPDETLSLTRAMQAAGETLDWGDKLVLDKHCVGGLPGNRTTPIVVAIVAAAGHVIPKTSSRAITSPAGTADTMEVMAPVALDIAAMRRVVETQGGCVVWGGGLHLSPVDDVLIRIERPLDFDSEGQLVASVLSKKAAAGAKRVVIDIPVGPTAKVRSQSAAAALSARFESVAAAIGLELIIQISDGSQPVGRGIGPTLEAEDVLKVLRLEADAPADLRDRALTLSRLLLDMGGGLAADANKARELLDSGAAERRFMEICEAQGGFSEPQQALHKTPVTALRDGMVTAIDNRGIARVAKLAGAPQRAQAGVLMRACSGDPVHRGDPLFEIHAETPGELAYARDYVSSQPSLFRIEEQI